MLNYDPAMLTKALETFTAIAAGGITLFLAAWIILQALKKEMPGLRKYLVRIVLGIAVALVAAYLFLPLLFVGMVATILVAALILGADATIKRMTNKQPPDKPAT